MELVEKAPVKSMHHMPLLYRKELSEQLGPGPGAPSAMIYCDCAKLRCHNIAIFRSNHNMPFLILACIYRLQSLFFVLSNSLAFNSGDYNNISEIFREICEE